jgi:hypothetical protein
MCLLGKEEIWSDQRLRLLPHQRYRLVDLLDTKLERILTYILEARF